MIKGPLLVEIGVHATCKINQWVSYRQSNRLRDCVRWWLRDFLYAYTVLLISVYNFTAKWCASFENHSILNFNVYGDAWHKATIEFVQKYILISWFWAVLEVLRIKIKIKIKIRKSAYGKCLFVLAVLCFSGIFLENYFVFKKLKKKLLLLLEKMKTKT